MKRFRTSLVALLLAAAIGSSSASVMADTKVKDPSEPWKVTVNAETDQILAFVERLYSIALDRESDPGGLSFWTEKLKKREMTGADCVRGFLVDTPEFKNRALPDEEVVETLYLTILDRASEPAGKAYWLQRLKNGLPVLDLVLLFIDTTEWCNLCASYGIRSGALTAKADTPSEMILKVAGNFYTSCLHRAAGDDEARALALRLINREVSMSQLLVDFYLSEEFLARKTSDTEFVSCLYQTCFFRPADETGKKYWASLLSSKATTRYQVICSFSEAAEFKDICDKYDLEIGSLNRKEDPYAPKQYVEPVIPGGERWYNGYVDPRTVRAELMTHPEEIAVLVNKYHSIPLDYVPELVEVSHSNGQRMRPEAAAAWERLFVACKAATGESLYMISGFRSEDTQRASFYRAIENHGIATAVKLYAWPGRSEHPLGLAMDICTYSNMNKSEFIYTEAGKWMLAHGHEFGFIWRYPEGGGSITGIGKEAWHFRYVGVEVATDMYNKGIRTLEEYYGERG